MLLLRKTQIKKRVMTLFFMKVLNMKYFIVAILCLINFSSNSFANWDYDKSSKSIYSIYKTEDNMYGDVYIIAKIVGNEISFIATVPFSEYQKVFTLKPPIILSYKGKKLVKHDLFFWGKKGNIEKIKIGNESFNSFYKNNNNEYQILNNKKEYSKLIEAFKKGNQIILDKHYWNKNNKKSYPLFSLTGFTESYNKYIEGNKQSKTVVNEFDSSMVISAKSVDKELLCG